MAPCTPSLPGHCRRIERGASLGAGAQRLQRSGRAALSGLPHDDGYNCGGQSVRLVLFLQELTCLAPIDQRGQKRSNRPAVDLRQRLIHGKDLCIHMGNAEALEARRVHRQVGLRTGNVLE